MRRIGSVTHIGPLTEEKIDAKEAAELDQVLAGTFHDLLTTEAERLKQERIPFEVSDFVSRRKFAFDQLSTRQREFVQQMFLRQRAWEEYLATRVPGRRGVGFSFQERYEPKPHEDLSRMPEVVVSLSPAYDVGIQTYRVESLSGSGEVKCRPFSWVSYTLE